MEFLGDLVLGIVISDYLFNEEVNLFEGELIKFRVNIVCEDLLSEVVNDINLGIYMLLGRGEEVIGGRYRILILVDVFEVVIVVIYFDGGFESVR